MNTFSIKKNFSPSRAFVSEADVPKNKFELSKRLLLSISVFLLSFAFLTHPSIPQTAVSNALTFCFKALIPSLFPFMIAGELLISAGFPELCEKYFGKAFQKLFGINGKGSAAFVIGAFCGFPVGARAAVSLYLSGDIEKEDAESLSGICNNCGIGFLISGIGAGMWGSLFFGVILYLSQLCSAALSGILLSRAKKRKRTPPPPTYNTEASFKYSHVNSTKASFAPPRKDSPKVFFEPLRKDSPKADFSLSRALSDAVASAVTAILKVMGFIVFFEIVLSLVGTLLDACNTPTLLTDVIFAFTELTAGAKALCSLSLTPSPLLHTIAKILTFTFSSFGGLSVYMQFCAIALPEGVKSGAYIKTKLTQSFFSTLLGCAFVALKVV